MAATILAATILSSASVLGEIFSLLGVETVFMMAAYFDESGTHQNSPAMCVAGYLFDADQAIRLDREWRDVLDLYGVKHFHAKECAHARGEFERMTPRQRHEILVRLIGIIRRRATIGIAVSISETDFNSTEPPVWKSGGPYLVAVLHALAGVVAWADTRGYLDRISYFFESGHKHQGIANRAIGMLSSSSTGSAGLRYMSHSFGGKVDFTALQAADILAYEWYKEMMRANGPRTGRGPRRSFVNLMESPCMYQHFGARDLDAMFNQDRAFMLDKMRRFEVVP